MPKREGWVCPTCRTHNPDHVTVCRCVAWSEDEIREHEEEETLLQQEADEHERFREDWSR